MADTRIIFHRQAAGEYRSARDWYRERSADASRQFVFAVDRAVDQIATRADSLPVLSGSFRYIRVTGFPYVLVFRGVEKELLKVVAVAHTSRRPGYWRRRR